MILCAWSHQLLYKWRLFFKTSGSLISEEVLFSESSWILHSQKSVCSAESNQTAHEWNLQEQGKTLLETAKFPAWLTCDHHITRLITSYCRHRVMHNGVRLRSHFWLTKGQQFMIIRKQIFNWGVCRRHKGRSCKVKPLSDMPEFRFKEWCTFVSTGTDVSGPLFVKTVFKVYICIFSCESTRAIYILGSLRVL